MIALTVETTNHTLAALITCVNKDVLSWWSCTNSDLASEGKPFRLHVTDLGSDSMSVTGVWMSIKNFALKLIYLFDELDPNSIGFATLVSRSNKCCCDIVD